MMLHLSVRKMGNDDNWIDDVTDTSDVLGIMVVDVGFNVRLTLLVYSCCNTVSF